MPDWLQSDNKLDFIDRGRCKLAKMAQNISEWCRLGQKVVNVHQIWIISGRLTHFDASMPRWCPWLPACRGFAGALQHIFRRFAVVSYFVAGTVAYYYHCPVALSSALERRHTSATRLSARPYAYCTPQAVPGRTTWTPMEDMMMNKMIWRRIPISRWYPLHRTIHSSAAFSHMVGG